MTNYYTMNELVLGNHYTAYVDQEDPIHVTYSHDIEDDGTTYPAFYRYDPETKETHFEIVSFGNIEVKFMKID